MSTWWSRLFGRRRVVRSDAAMPRASYDAAQTTDDNRRYWAQADALSPAKANTLAVRKILRNRSRYHRANSPYYHGAIETLVHYTIGTGPTLQVMTPDDAINDAIEQRWREWSEEVGIADVLAEMRRAKAVDGEAFAILVADDTVPEIGHRWMTIECDMVTDPMGVTSDVDGIEFGPNGLPAFYYVATAHPGDGGVLSAKDFRKLPASDVIHWFRRERPGQWRGVPELTSSLEMMAILRRFVTAALSAAEIASLFGVVLKSNLPPNEEEQITPWTRSELQRGAMMALPFGYEAVQIKPEHPHQALNDIVHVCLREALRPVSMPYILAAGDSSHSNYSSARLDMLIFRAAVEVEQEHCRRHVLERIFRTWYATALTRSGYLPDNSPESVTHVWQWPGFAFIDPLKESQAVTERLTNGTMSFVEACAAEGKDWQDVVQQHARVLAYMRQLGVPVPPWAGTGGEAVGTSLTEGADTADEDADAADEEDESGAGGDTDASQQDARTR